MFSNDNDYEQLKTQVARLAEHYRQLTDSIEQGVSMITFEGCILAVNPAIERLTGYSRVELVGSHIQRLIHPSDLPFALDRLQRLKDGQSQRVPIKLRVRQSSGGYRSVEIASLPEAAADELKSIRILVRDLAEEEQIERGQLEIARQKSQIQSLLTLLYHASVMVRSPLTSIGVNAHLLSKALPEAAARAAVANISRRIQDLGAMMARVVDLAELETEQLEFSFKPVNLNRLLRYSQANAHFQAEIRQISFNLTITDDILLVWADEMHLYHAIQEMVEYALESTPDYGTISLSLAKNNGYAVLTLVDTGRGIASELIPHLFEKRYCFSQPPSKVGQLGLSLPIVQNIVSKHGGTIEVVSVPGEGSAFTIMIPHLPR